VGQTVPVGALVGVIADADVGDEAIDAFIATFAPVDLDVEEGGASEPRIVSVGEHRINYLRKGGPGPVVLFVHGFGGDAAGWGFVQEVLAADHDTIALDLPGHGASSKAISDGSLAGQAAIVADFLRALDLGPVNLVGHSMGGGVCIALAAAHPDHAASLTLLAPMGLGAEINADYLSTFATAQRRRDVEPALRLLFADEALVTKALAEEVVKYKRVDGVSEALAAIERAILDHGSQKAVLREDLAGLAQPVALLAGAEDRIIPPAPVAALGGTLLPSVGHMPQVEAPDQVIAAIRKVARA